MHQLITLLRKLSGNSTPVQARLRCLHEVGLLLPNIDATSNVDGHFEAFLDMLAAPLTQLHYDTSGVLLEVQKVLLEFGLLFPNRYRIK